MVDMKQAIETVQSIYQMLEDQESKDIYLSRLAYLISKDLKHLLPCLDSYLLKWNKALKDTPPWISIIELSRMLPENRNIVLYGAGEDGKKLLDYLQDDKRFIGFCSSTKAKQESGYLGYPVMSPEELLARKDLSVVISTSRYKDDIRQFLEDGKYPNELIFEGAIYACSNDGEAEQYFGPDFMKFCDEEVFVDAGCCNFESTLALAKHCKKVKKVYAFEPDPYNYPKCLDVFKKTSRKRILDAKILPCGTWSEKKTLHFKEDQPGCSRICSEGNANSSIPVMPIDEAIEPGDRVTMIKMDIEGAELESLKGARKTIQRDKPKLAICIYHKPEDMWEIPLYIKELVPEYRLYIRHHCRADGETVLYAVMPE